MKILKNKLLILLLLSATPLFSKEAYFQKTQQHSLISALGKVGSVMLWNPSNQLEPLEEIGGLNLEFYGRATEANVFGTFKIKGTFNFQSNNLLKTPNFFIYSGIGGFLFDKRNEIGIGSFMTMSFNVFFYPFTYDFSLGVSLDTRYSYSFHPISAFTIGLDLEYKISYFDKNSILTGFHNFGIGLSFGFTFNTYK